jgi:hypothetical protein
VDRPRWNCDAPIIGIRRLARLTRHDLDGHDLGECRFDLARDGERKLAFLISGGTGSGKPSSR